MTGRKIELKNTHAFSDEVWLEVLQSVDQAYKELVDYQVELEDRNLELEGMRGFLTSILGAMSDILLVSGPEGQILEVNQAFMELTGHQRGDALGLQVQDVFADHEREDIRVDLNQLRAGYAVQHKERDILINGASTPLDLSITARLDGRGRYVGAVLLGRPVGELRRAYQEMEESHQALKHAQSQLVHSEKLASLGRLLAGVAHELNNPISFVYGNAHALERYTERFETYFKRVENGADRPELVTLRHDLKLDRAVKQMRSAVSGALEGAERVRDLVESLRQLSADGTGAFELFNLRELVETAVVWVIKGRVSNVPVEITCPDEVIAYGRPSHIQQVVMNLIQNALDAMEETPDPAVALIIFKDGDRAVLEVADKGPGIPEDVALRVFDPFFTTKDVGKGTGLGLSISYKIVEENRGELSCRNGAQGGAVFRLGLPMSSGVSEN